MQSSAEFLSAAAVQGLEFSTGSIERRCSVALAGRRATSQGNRMHVCGL